MDGVGVAPGQVDAVRVVLGQDAVLVALHGEGDARRRWRCRPAHSG